MKASRVKRDNRGRFAIRGDEYTYAGLHRWISKCLGKAETCSDCGSEKRVQWANVSKKYLQELKDWKELCAVCHRKFDGITKLDKRDAYNIKIRYQNGERQMKIAECYGVSNRTISNVITGRTKYYA